MSTVNARPFDPHNRPLKGEWVVVGEASSAAASQTVVMQSAAHDTSLTQGFDAIQRKSKPFPIWIVVIVVALVVGGVAYALLSNRGGAPSNRAVPNRTAPSVSQGGSAVEGAPVLTRVPAKERHDARTSTFVYEFDLKVESSKLDPIKPTTFSIKGGSATQRLQGDTIVFQISKEPGKSGSLEITGLNYAKDSRRNPNAPEAAKATWTAPAIAPIGAATGSRKPRPDLGTGASASKPPKTPASSGPRKPKDDQ